MQPNGVLKTFYSRQIHPPIPMHQQAIVLLQDAYLALEELPERSKLSREQIPEA